MLTNPVIESMLNRKSVRKYTDQKPTDEVINTVVRAGQQAPLTEHISRKSGQWWSDPNELLDQMEKCGFVIGTKDPDSRD